MATVIRTPPLKAPSSLPSTRIAPIPLKAAKPFCLFFGQRNISNSRLHFRTNSLRFVKFVPLASTGETETTETEEEIQEPKVEDPSDSAVTSEDASDDDSSDSEATHAYVILETLQFYKEALASNDDTKVAEIEAFLKSIEDEKIDLEGKVAKFSDELTVERDRVLRIGADFDNFRKRTERERLSLMTNAQGEVVERLLQVLDNFERAKTQIKVQTEGEEKINNSYQSIYKQLLEILGSLGVVPVETIGNPFDPLLHEAIMQEESTEFEESVIIEEFRKGFKLGDRLLRPSMVKVSAGPGPAKPKEVEPSEGEAGAAKTAASNMAEVEAESS